MRMLTTPKTMELHSLDCQFFGRDFKPPCHAPGNEWPVRHAGAPFDLLAEAC